MDSAKSKKQKKEGIAKFFEEHPHHRAIFKKMLEVKGLSFDTFDFTKPSWFLDQTWTEKEENEFKAWMAGYLKATPYACYELTESRTKTKTFIKKVVEEFTWNYGWKSA